MGRVRLTAIKKRSVTALVEAKATLCKKTVKNSTTTTYESHVRTMSKMIAKMRKSKTADVLTMTKDELIEMLVELETQGCGSGPAFLSALRKAALVADIDITHLNGADVDALANAGRRSAKSATKPCGTLDDRQFEELREYLKQLGPRSAELFYATVIAFRARLRIGELYELRAKDMLCEDGYVFLRLLACKQSRDGTDANPDPKLVPASLRAAILACAAERFGDGDRLFSRNIDGRLREALPRWATALKWPTNLRWSGPHVFRHAGSQTVDRLANEIGRSVLSIVSQQTTGTFANYAKPANRRLS